MTGVQTCALPIYVGGDDYFDDSSPAPNGAWWHYAICVTGARARWYRNGAFEKQASSANVNTSNHSLNGLGHGTMPYTIDDFAILDEFLGAAKIKLVYTCGNNGTLKYDFGKVWSVFEGHALEKRVKLDDRYWDYVDGLSGGSAGDLRNDGDGQYTMFITATTGMSSRLPIDDGAIIVLR